MFLLNTSYKAPCLLHVANIVKQLFYTHLLL